MTEKHNHPGRGFFLTFEGPEGAGKTTQLRLTAAYLKEKGWRCVATREPGGTPVAEKLRDILKGAPEQEKLHSNAELLLIEAARAQHVAEVIRPALERGEAVLCDRFFDSTTAYQGVARKIDAGLIEELNDFACDGCRPDLTLMLDLAPEVGFHRAASRPETVGVTDRFEAENGDFHHAVRDGFLRIAGTEPERVRVIVADAPPEEVQRRIREVVDEFIR